MIFASTPDFVEDVADAGADHAFDAQALFFLDRRLYAAELHEVLGLDDPEHFDPAVGLGCTPRRKAQRNARFGAVVDDDQVGAFGFAPPFETSAALNPA